MPCCRTRSAAIEEMEALLLQEADPLSVTVNGQPIKQEIEWSDEEMDLVEKGMIKEESPPSSPPTISVPSPAPAGDEKKTLAVRIKLPGGKAVPATFILDPKRDSTSEFLSVWKQSEGLIIY